MISCRRGLLLASRNLAECPLYVVRPQPPVTPGGNQVDDLLNGGLNPCAAEKPARHRHPVDYSQASEIVEKPEQIAGKEKHLAVVAISLGITVLEGLFRRAQDFAPVILRPTPKGICRRSISRIRTVMVPARVCRGGRTMSITSSTGLEEAQESLTHMFGEVPEDPLRAAR